MPDSSLDPAALFAAHDNLYISDHDNHNDFGDYGDVAYEFALDRMGAMTVLGVNCCTPSYGGPASFKAIGDRAHGVTDASDNRVLYGQSTGVKNAGVGGGPPLMAKRFGRLMRGSQSFSTNVQFYRRLFANAQAKSITIGLGGNANGVMNWINSPGDTIDPRTGAQQMQYGLKRIVGEMGFWDPSFGSYGGSNPNLAENSLLSGKALARPDVARPAVAHAAARSAPAIATAPAADVSAYLSDLTQLSTLVSHGDTADVAARYATFAADDQAVFGTDLLPLTDRANAAVAAVPANRRATLAKFQADAAAAVNATTLANLQLTAWGTNPSAASRAAVTAQFTRAAAAVRAADRDAVAVRAVLAGRAIPATLSIEETTVPTTAADGSIQTFTFTVSNPGESATAAGSVAFTNDDGGLVVQGAATQPLPALDPGGSAIVTFQVVVTTPANGDATLPFQVVASAADVTAQVTDTVALG